MKMILCAATAAIALMTPLAAEEEKPAPGPADIVAAAPAGDWAAIAPADLLVMDLAPLNDAPRRVVIQLMPAPFSQGWVGNIRKLAAAHWWDGTSVYRVQDNYVAQWGDADGDDAAKARRLPEGLAVVPERCYVSNPYDTGCAIGDGAASSKASGDVSDDAAAPVLFSPARRVMAWQLGGDAYQVTPDFIAGWPVAASFGGRSYLQTWPVHCYAMVGVARDLSPNTGTGAELYTVIGHAPRHLDRNIALVGRVIEGMAHLSSLPRGSGALGIYETPEERTAILSVRLGSDVPDLPAYEYLSTESEAFAAYAEARANRRDPFFIVPAGGADICNIPVPVRRAAR